MSARPRAPRGKAGRAPDVAPAAVRFVAGGVLVTGTPIACDAPRAAEVAFVGHAHAPASPRSSQLVMTAEVLAQRPELAARRTATLTPSTGRPFSLGELRVELLPTHFSPGAAALLVEHAGRRVLYAGALPADAEPEARPADVLVVDGRAAAFARVPTLTEAAPALRAAIAKVHAAGAAAVLACPPGPLVARVATLLAAGGAPLFAALGLVGALTALRPAWPELPQVRTLPRGALPSGAIVLAGPRVAAAPGRRVLWLDAATRAPADTIALPVREHAAAPALAAYARTTGATEVYVTAASDAGLAALAAAGLSAVRALGAPRQLSLF